MSVFFKQTCQPNSLCVVACVAEIEAAEVLEVNRPATGVSVKAKKGPKHAVLLTESGHDASAHDLKRMSLMSRGSKRECAAVSGNVIVLLIGNACGF